MNLIAEIILMKLLNYADDGCYYCCCFPMQLLIHIFIYNFCFVNSPLLLELLPCGQVQVMKASRYWLLCPRLWYVTGWGFWCLILSFLMYHFIWRTCCWRFYYYEINCSMMRPLCQGCWILLLVNYQMNIPLQTFYKDDMVENI